MTLPPSYFEALYAKSMDPWEFRTRWYEGRKRAVTLAALPEPRYGRVFEPGCSFGLLTKELATRADTVVAMDISRTVLDSIVEVPVNVTLRVGSVPADWPDGRFDLSVVSELGYYLSEPDCQQVARLAAETTDELVLVHWRHPVADYPTSGDTVHQIFRTVCAERGMANVVHHTEEDLFVDVWSRDHRGVAARTGIR